MRLVLLALLAACGHPHPFAGGDAATGGTDAPTGHRDAPGQLADAHTDGSTGHTDGAITVDGSTLHDASTGGVITGGPCLSGTAGGAAYRIHWANAGGQAQVVYEVDGLPDHSRDHAAAYGYQIGFTPSYVDPFLAEGGLQLDSSDFIDLEISTAGVSQIASATLSIYGRSFDTTTSGSFNWQTFAGTGASPTDSVSNIAPYAWYSADMTTELAPNDATTLIRIKAGPSSGVLVVHRLELCIQAS